MPTIPLPQKIEQLTYEIATLKESISFLEIPVAAPPTAAAGSLMAMMSATLTAIGTTEELERSRLTKLEAMQNLLTDAELTLAELEKQQNRSKPLFDAGIIRLEKTRKKCNESVDSLVTNWDSFQQALKAIEDDALTQIGAVPYSRTGYPMESQWLGQLGKVGPMDKQGCFNVVRAYEFDRLHNTDGE